MDEVARVGSSGWAYDDWRDPNEVKLKEQLAFYASIFDTAEIDASFYRLPTDKAAQTWADQVPDGFLFAWKVSRYIAHNKKLKDCRRDSSLRPFS